MKFLHACRRGVKWLVMGGLISIAVSWAIAAWMPRRTTSVFYLAEHARYQSIQILNIRLFYGIGWVMRSWDLDIVWSDGMRPFRQGAPSVLPEYPSWIDEQPISWLRWGRLEHVRPDPQARGVDGFEHATGWPLPMLWYGMNAGATNGVLGVTVDGGIRLDRRSQPAGEARVLPLQPIWVGVAANSLFWGAAACGATIGTRRCLAAKRRKRGQCPRCGYDVSGSIGCPECGWNR